MAQWAFLPDPLGDAPLGDADLAKYRLQTISDIYRAMQSRLDGYRQAGAAVFLSASAGLLTLDSACASAVGRIILGIETVPGRNALVHHRVGWLMVLAGIVLLFARHYVLGIFATLGKNFSEMTSIVYKIDLANDVFSPGKWLAGEKLYPKSFETSKTLEVEGESLVVWHDPSLKFLTTVVRWSFGLNAAVFLLIGIPMVVRHGGLSLWSSIWSN